MKKCCLFVVSLLSALIFLSCSLGLDPAKSGSTEVSFSVGEATAGRLIAPGTGYLYIRTVGGPTGDNGPFYGPFQLSAGSVFTTTEIPAGSYDGFGILYATEPLGGLSNGYLDEEYNGMTFNDFMNLPDDEFIEFGFLEGLLGEYPNHTAFDILIDGRATAEMLENVRIVAGQRNVIAAKLVPVIGSQNSRNMSSTPYLEGFYINGNETARTERFFEIYNIDSYPTFIFQYNVSGTDVFMGSIFIYDQDGRILASDIVNSTSTEAYSGNFVIPINGEDSLYGYIDFIGSYVELTGNLQ